MSCKDFHLGSTITPERLRLYKVVSNRSRFRLLYVVDALDHDYQSEVTQGVVEAARRHKADLTILVGGATSVSNRYLKHRHFVYEVAEPRNFDGIVYLGTTLSSQQGRSMLAPLVMRFEELPTVSIGLDVGKGTTILVDNAKGMTKLMEHLLDVHGFERFAFISGPLTNMEAAIRLKSFTATLAGRGLERPALLFEGDFNERSGEAAIEHWRSEAVDLSSLDAIVAANDAMAFGAMAALKRQGLGVPEDVAIVGFDDVNAACFADTPLTTVQQPLKMQGAQAVQCLLASVEGLLLEPSTISSRLVVRRSCGCRGWGEPLDTGPGADRTSQRPIPAPSSIPPDYTTRLGKVIASHREVIIDDLTRLALSSGIITGWQELLVNAVIDELSDDAPTRSMTDIVKFLVQNSVESGEQMNPWTAVITTIDRHLSRLVQPGSEDSVIMESVIYRARVALIEATEQVYATRIRNYRRQSIAFKEAAVALLTAQDANALKEAATTHLPRLGIETCSISLF